MITRPRPGGRARCRAVSAVFVALVGLLLGVSQQVTAAPIPRHTSLRSITPADGATLTTPPTEIVLVFDEPVAQQFTQVVLTRSGVAVSLGETTVSSGTVRAAVPGRLDAGSYRIAFRVVSTDGHPVTGQSGFEVIGPGPSTSAGVGAPSGVASATPSAAAPSSATGDGALAPGQVPTGEANHTPGYLVSGALLLAAGMLLLWERRRRRRVDFPPEQRAV